MANSMILDTYTWNNRLVVLITDKDQTNLEKQVKTFFEEHECTWRRIGWSCGGPCSYS